MEKFVSEEDEIHFHRVKMAMCDLEIKHQLKIKDDSWDRIRALEAVIEARKPREATMEELKRFRYVHSFERWKDDPELITSNDAPFPNAVEFRVYFSGNAHIAIPNPFDMNHVFIPRVIYADNPRLYWATPFKAAELVNKYGAFELEKEPKWHLLKQLKQQHPPGRFMIPEIDTWMKTMPPITPTNPTFTINRDTFK